MSRSKNTRRKQPIKELRKMSGPKWDLQQNSSFTKAKVSRRQRQQAKRLAEALKDMGHEV